MLSDISDVFGYIFVFTLWMHWFLATLPSIPSLSCEIQKQAILTVKPRDWRMNKISLKGHFNCLRVFIEWLYCLFVSCRLDGGEEREGEQNWRGEYKTTSTWVSQGPAETIMIKQWGQPQPNTSRGVRQVPKNSLMVETRLSNQTFISLQCYVNT